MTVSSKVRLYDLAKDLKVDTKRLIEDVRREGVKVSVPSNRISKELADKIRDEYFPKKNARVKQTSQFAQSAAGVSASPNEPASREESAKDSGVEKRLNTCRICGVVCRSKSGLDNHFLNYHREEAFSDAVSRLKLENVSLESFSELQRKSFGEPRWFIDACLRGWGYIS